VTVGAWIGLALLGGVGAVARFGIDRAISAGREGEFPLGTFAINVVGAFVLGVLTGAAVTGTWLFVAGTGFLGSFTTFSTWIFETDRLAEDGEAGVALANLGASVAAGLAAAGAGWAMGALL
jgi:fluoride exporter